MKYFWPILILILLGCGNTASVSETAVRPAWECPAVHIGTLHFLELDGCTWVIETIDEKRLEPLNLRDFISDSLLHPQRIFRIEYDYEAQPAPSICMTGPTITIKCLKILE